MPLLKKYKGVLITKRPKVFDDGTGGAFCEIVCQPDVDGHEQVLSFWAKSSTVELLGKEEAVEGYDDKKARVYELQVSSYEGKEKRHLVGVK